MLSSHLATARRRPARAVIAAVVGVVAVATLLGEGGVRADTTIVYDDAGGAADIGVIGDSTLSGVRWHDEYGRLRDYNFVFDAESCRRTIETSCWSREGFRAENAMTTLQRLSGEWGEVLVVMTGYNDSNGGFDEAVDAVVAEAQRQGIPRVVWLSLRTTDVSYEEPLHLANANSYRESNRVLYDKAEQYGGYLQVADWATYSADKGEWFANDGVHLTVEGAGGVTSFIADTAGRLLDGETVTPAIPPWDTLTEGDYGESVAAAQQALVDAGGVDHVGGVDGQFGAVTVDAVGAFQRERGLDVTGEVDESTAVALGLHEATFESQNLEEQAAQTELSPSGAEGPTAPVGRPELTPSRAGSTEGMPAAADVVAAGTAPADGSSERRPMVWEILAAAVVLVAVAVVARRVRRRSAAIRAADAPDEPDKPASVYDHEREDALLS